MILSLSIGFGLGVLAVVLASAVDRKRRTARPLVLDMVVEYPRFSAEYARNYASYGSANNVGYLLAPMDHTLTAKDK